MSNLAIEHYIPVVKQNGGLYSTLPATIDNAVTITGVLSAQTVGISGTTVALGATTAATIGDIGASGPTTAAQNSWFPVKAGSTTYFLPAWV